MTRTVLLPTLLLGTAGLFAQTPAAPGLEAPTPVIGDRRIPVHDHGGDPEYGTWAAGAAYKVRFANGTTFYPQLGRDYPHNQPFGWRTTSVRVGEHELLTPGRAAVMAKGDFRVTFDHGAVTECYDVLAEGLEQSFVLARRPLASGDLCITGAITTALTTTPVQEAEGYLSFHDENGDEIVRYGRALAIDADGDVFRVTTTCTGDHITLRLAAGDLARADFPLVVDPLQSAQYVGNIGTISAIGELDTATETAHTLASTAFAYTRHFSATDADVVTSICQSTLAGSYQQFVDLSAAASADHARLAFVPATNRWVVVYQNLITATQQMQLRAAMFDGGSTANTATNSVPHLVATGTHEWRPVVGGILDGATGNKVLVTFQQETGTTNFANTATSKVHGMLFDTSTASGTWSAPFLIYGSASEDAERPSVNRRADGGGSFSWFVVCQAFTNNAGNDDWDLIGKLVTNAGSVSPGQWISSLGTTHKLGPVVDGCHGRFAVLFSTASTTIGKNLDVLGNDVRCERVNWAHGEASQSPSGDWPVQTLASNTFRLLEPTAAAYNPTSRSHWYLTWRSSSTAPATYMTLVGYRGQALQNADLIASTGANTPGPASVLHSASLHFANCSYMLSDGTLYSRNTNVLPMLSPTQQGASCTTAALTWDGPSSNNDAENLQVGNELTSVRAASAPAGALHLVLVAMGTLDVPLSMPPFGDNCHLLVPFDGPDYLGMLPLGVGSDVTWPLPLPEHLPLMTLYLQDLVLHPNDNLLHGTSRLSVPLIK
ncbi:MAG: hypothetical protein IT456_20245 [Planctomycetes bacterium]|nr:hypothetical protein [Planctomycetota bacterium]MCC7065150.1 hypothetical protein [Planctomycetota bacterium]